MDLKRLQLAKECVGIINQLYDLAEVPVEKRQDINDKADKYLLDQALRLCGVIGSADADYWSERCKHAENIWEKNPCDPDITEEQIEAHNEYHNFIKENGSKHYR